MPISSRMIPREGITAETVGRLISSTILNPALTLPLLLLLRYTAKGESYALLHETLVRRLRYAFYLGAFRWASSWLSQKTHDNWSSDVYHWKDAAGGKEAKEVVVVTGGSDGIGKEVALLLAESAKTVVVLDVQPLRYEAPANVHFYKCDITNPAAISTAADTIRLNHGHPTVLVNNAGVALGSSILTSTPASLRLTFDVNTLAHYHLAREFLPSMISTDHGMVVTVASLAAYVPAPKMVDYAASKSAALAFHEGLSGELRSTYGAKKVRTVLVTQGYTKTPLFEGFNSGNHFVMPALEPLTVAEGLVRQVLSGRSGQVILPGNAGWISGLRALPGWLQTGIRSGEGVTAGMTTWKGRKVIDPEERYKSEEAAEKDGHAGALRREEGQGATA